MLTSADRAASIRAVVLLLLSTALAAAPAASADPLKVAAPGLDAANMAESMRQFCSDHLAQQLALQGVRVTTPSEIGAILGLERQKQLLGCAARNYTTLRNLGDERLLSTEVVASDEEPVSDTTVSAGVRHELLAIADASFGQVSGCFGSERAGLPRREIIVDPDGGIQETHESPRICEVNGVRTADFLPILTRPDLGEGVLESECTVSADSRPICDVMIVDSPEECPGEARIA